MVKRDQHVHLRLGAANPLIRNIQLIARVAALYERGIFAVAEHAVSRSLETFRDNCANGVSPLSGSADDFDGYAGHGLISTSLLQNIYQLFSPASYCLLLTIGLVYDLQCWKNQPTMMLFNVVLQMIRRPSRVEISIVPEPDGCARLRRQI